jgi:predicted nucleic acid-binding protein
MKIFLDTSSLFKLYHREADTVIIEQIFSQLTVTNVYLSEITKVEFTSSVWKKVRTKEITEIFYFNKRISRICINLRHQCSKIMRNGTLMTRIYTDNYRFEKSCAIVPTDRGATPF